MTLRNCWAQPEKLTRASMGTFHYWGLDWNLSVSIFHFEHSWGNSISTLRMKMKWDYSYSGTVSTKKDDELFSKVASPNCFIFLNNTWTKPLYLRDQILSCHLDIFQEDKRSSFHKMFPWREEGSGVWSSQAARCQSWFLSHFIPQILHNPFPLPKKA